jgi:hypothetical protein
MVDAVAEARTRFPSFEILGKSQSSSATQQRASDLNDVT